MAFHTRRTAAHCALKVVGNKVKALTWFLEAVLLLGTPVAADWGSFVAINPGMKVGYEFGRTPGFTLGAEVDATVAMANPFVYAVWGGVVLGTQFNFRQRRWIHYQEVEAGIPLVGTALGFEWRGHVPIFHIRAFNGLVAYVSYKYVPRVGCHELSFIPKYTVFVNYTVDHSGTIWWKRLDQLLWN